MHVSSDDTAPKPWGPDNPHPLSTKRTELVWEGKYDEYGNRRPVRLPNFPLVLQKIETIDAPRDEAQAQGALFETATAHRDDFRNRLIWGDNKLVLASLLDEFRGQVDLIYIDPPFDIGADFTMDVPIGDADKSVAKQQSVLESVAYRDIWGRGAESFISMVAERLLLARDLLTSSGSILLHIDAGYGHVVRLVMDEIFGSANFVNEIVWSYSTSGRPNDRFPQKHDNIYWYRRSEKHAFYPDQAKIPYSREYLDSHFKDVDAEGRRCRKRLDSGKWRTYYPEEGMLPNDVWDIPYVNSQAIERTGYPTQKPEVLLERLISATTKEGDLVLDCFCGSGTTPSVAERLGRRWIACDLGRYAVHTARKRLIGVQRDLHASDKPYRSFDVYNMGRYERQWWQQERLRGADDEHRAAVLKFFRAVPLSTSPSPHLHATRGGAYVHVDSIDGIFTRQELDLVARAAAQVGAKELICLSWVFEMNLAAMARNLSAELGVQIRLTYIPREIMEANRRDVQFFDASVLTATGVVKMVGGRKAVDVRLTGFFPNLTEVPEREMSVLQERAVKSPFDFIDFWAIDFEYGENKPFEHHWQDYRTRKDRTLLTESTCGYQYATPGKKKICVKVIDVFGVDTSTVIEVDL